MLLVETLVLDVKLILVAEIVLADVKLETVVLLVAVKLMVAGKRDRILVNMIEDLLINFLLLDILVLNRLMVYIAVQAIDARVLLTKDVHHVVVQLINLVETHHVDVILIIKELDQYVVAQ